eukprot:6880039-Heterocapsa_arctica.AAC.1
MMMRTVMMMMMMMMMMMKTMTSIIIIAIDHDACAGMYGRRPLPNVNPDGFLSSSPTSQDQILVA